MVRKIRPISSSGLEPDNVLQPIADPLRKCFGMATGKTCPHGDEDRIHISGTQQRAMLAEDAPVPREFGRPEVIEILRAYYASLG
jgi:ATP sulfurylase